MKMKRKIMIIGAGGIGSFLVSNLARLGIYDITVFDDDKVERKNLLHQNLHHDMIGEKKVESIVADSGSSNIRPQPFPVLVEKQLDGYDLVICCADNLAVRRLLYRQGFGARCQNKWLDLRSQGRNGALISYLTDEKLMDTLLAGPEGSFSCQGNDWDGSAEQINLTHIAIAGIASQWIQQWFLNNEKVIDKMVINI